MRIRYVLIIFYHSLFCSFCLSTTLFPTAVLVYIFFNDGLRFTWCICCVNLDMELSLLETCELGGGYTVEDKDSLFSDSEDNMSKYYP